MIDAEGLTGRERRTRAAGGLPRPGQRVGQALCLYGDPGVGKTRLLDVTAAAAGRRGQLVHRAAGGYLESDLPWATLHQLLFPLTGHAHRRDAAEHALLDLTLVPTPDSHMIAETTGDLLKPAVDEPATLRSSLRSSWVGDQASRTVLHHLADRGAGSRIGLLAASRAPPSRPASPFRRSKSPHRARRSSLLSSTRTSSRSWASSRRLLAAGEGNALAMRELGTVIEADRRFGRVEAMVPALPFGRLQRSYAPASRCYCRPARATLCCSQR